jgi:hypothetical protein
MQGVAHLAAAAGKTSPWLGPCHSALPLSHWPPFLRDLHSNLAAIAAVFGRSDRVAPGYDAFGVIATIFRELGWKTPVFSLGSGPETSNRTAGKTALRLECTKPAAVRYTTSRDL